MIKRVIGTMIMVLVFASMANSQSVVKVLSGDVNKMMIEKSKAVLLDVRTPNEFNAGHLKGAVNINIADPEFYNRIGKLDKAATYVVYCRTQNRSGSAVNYMVQNGFTKVYQMTDGINGWNMNGLPVEM